MTVGASRAVVTITRQPALAPSPQPRPAPTARALPPNHVARGGQIWKPFDTQTEYFRFCSGPDLTDASVLSAPALAVRLTQPRIRRAENVCRPRRPRDRCAG